MADMTTNKTGLKVIATTSEKIRELTIADGQLIFIQDLTRIAFDFKGKRKYYNQITELESDADRIMLDSPLTGYYFVIDTAVLWFYKNGWTQITEKPEEVIFIGTSLPELGQAKENTIYVDKTNKEISVFDSDNNEYMVVADKTQSMTPEEVVALFNQN